MRRLAHEALLPLAALGICALETRAAADEPAPVGERAPIAEPAPAVQPLPPPVVGADGREDPTLRRSVAERRAGVVIGVTPGIAFAGASGYPNSSRLIGSPDFYSESPLLVGHSTTYFLMGALTDHVSFGPMVNVARFESKSWKSTGFGIGFRVEVFPLVRLFPTLADTAL